MNWLILVIFAIFIFCILNGLRRGFIRTIAAMCSVFISMALVYVLSPYVETFLEQQTPIYEMIEEKCTEAIGEGLQEQLGEEAESVFMDSLPLPDSAKKLLWESGDDGGYLTETFAGYLGASIAHMAVNTVSFLITYFIVSLVLHFLVAALNEIFRLPVLSTMNRIAGGALGCVQGLLLVWIFFLILTLFWNEEWAKEAVVMIQSNPFIKILYDINPFVKFISGLLG